jgi:hypothetical protein
MPFGIVDDPVTLTGEITIQRVQGGPQLCRRMVDENGGDEKIIAVPRRAAFGGPNVTSRAPE